MLQPNWNQSGPGDSTTTGEGYYEVTVGYDETGPALTVSAAVDADNDGDADDGSVPVDDLNFLNWTPGSIEGTKYFDQDGSSTINTGDIPLEGWTINLREDDNGNGVIDAGDDIIATTTTDASSADVIVR